MNNLLIADWNCLWCSSVFGFSVLEHTQRIKVLYIHSHNVVVVNSYLIRRPHNWEYKNCDFSLSSRPYLGTKSRYTKHINGHKHMYRGARHLKWLTFSDDGVARGTKILSLTGRGFKTCKKMMILCIYIAHKLLFDKNVYVLKYV